MDVFRALEAQYQAGRKRATMVAKPVNVKTTMGTRKRWFEFASAADLAKAAARAPAGVREPPGFEVKASGIAAAGNGLFTKVALKHGDVIGEYIGTNLTPQQAQPLENKNHYLFDVEVNPRTKKIGKIDHVVDAEDEAKSSCLRFVNSAENDEEQNTKFMQAANRMWLIAIKSIRRGAELFAYYGRGTNKITGSG